MKPLFVISSAERRGAQNQAVAVVDALGRRGVRASVAALEPGPGSRLDVPLLGPRALAPSTLRALRRTARAHDVVVAFGSSTLPACALALGRSRPWMYRSIGDPGAWVRSPLHRERTGALMRRAAAVTALWPGAANQIGALYRVRPDRLHVIPNARNPDAFPPVTPDERRSCRAAFGLSADGPVVLVLGALSEEKQVGDAIRAVSALAGAHLVIAGDGPDRAALEQLAASLCPSRVTFLGTVSRPGDAIAAADVTLLTSRTEGLPGSILESLYRGVPVVATDVGGVSAIVRPGVHGRLVPAGDVAALTEALADVLTWQQPAVLAGRADLAATYSIDGVTDRWLDLLGELAG